MNVAIPNIPDTNTIGERARADADVDRHFARLGRGPEFEMEADWIRRSLPNHAVPWADVGCGNGALIRAIRRQGAIGVDYGKLGLASTARACPDTPLICADAARLPFPDGSLGAITSQHLIEHLPDPGNACHEWFRVLEPNGLLILQTPNADFRDPSVFDDPSHLHVFDEGSLCRVVRDAGFTILDLRTLGLPWFRAYHRLPGGWRFRRAVITCAEGLSSLPGCRWRGQTLCCLAQKRVIP